MELASEPRLALNLIETLLTVTLLMAFRVGTTSTHHPGGPQPGLPSILNL